MRQYAAPPLVEAICEFQFIPETSWDVTVLGLVYERVKDDFGIKALPPAPLFNFTIGSVISPSARMQFRRPDNSALLQVSPNNLTVNHLTPYRGWPIFRGMIEQALSAYQEVAAPKGLSRLALRYINHIKVPAVQTDTTTGNVEVQEYVRTHPTVPVGVHPVYLEWAQRVVIPSNERTLVLQSGTAAGSPEFPFVFVLDLEMSPAEGSSVLLPNALDWLEQSHEGIESVFENCLGPKARILFGRTEGENAPMV